MNPKLTILALIFLSSFIHCIGEVRETISFEKLNELRRAKRKYLEATKRPLAKQYHQEEIREAYQSQLSGNTNVKVDESPDKCDELEYCYPRTGDLLVGRDSKISASSTCGMQGPERYCWPHSDDDCFYCDSRRYDYLYSHRIGKVIPHIVDRTPARTSYDLSTPDYSWFRAIQAKWWQSKTGDENVTVRIDFESKFVFDSLPIYFKYAFPLGMIIEMSDDFGQTWKKRVHYTHKCKKVFPHLPVVNIFQDGLDSIHAGGDFCYELVRPQLANGTYSVIRYTDPTVRRRQWMRMNRFSSPNLMQISQVTNIRMNFTHFPPFVKNSSLVHKPDDSAFTFERQYYAIYFMDVNGACMCNGHADRCIAPDNNQFSQDSLSRMEVFSKCVCKHNTTGNNCDLCQPGFHLPEGSRITDSRPCEPCGCNQIGTLNETVCDGLTDHSKGMESGRCHCKRNVEGTKCQKCMDGYDNLSEHNLDGCKLINAHAD